MQETRHNEKENISVKYLSPLVEIEIDRLIQHPVNKELFPMVDIDAIARSIKEYGMIEPIVIRPKEDFDEIIKFKDQNAETCLKHFKEFYICAGHRRVEALKRLGYRKVEARIIIPLYKGVDELVLIHENLMQRVLSPEIVKKALIRERTIFPIENVLKKLPKEIKNYYKKGLISAGFVRFIATQDKNFYKEVIDTLEKIEKLGFEGKVKSSQDLERLKQKLSEKEEEVKKLFQEKEKVDREKKKLEKEKNILENSIRRLNEAVSLREEKLQRLHENLVSLKTELNQLQQQVTLTASPELEEKIRRSKQKIREISSKLRIKEEEIKQIKSKLKEEREKYKALKEEMQRIIERETEKRIEEIKQEFQNILTVTRKQLEKEREEKEKLLQEIDKLTAQKNAAFASKNSSKNLSPEERTVLGVIAHVKSFTLFMAEHGAIIRDIRHQNPDLYKEAIITLKSILHVLAKTFSDLEADSG